MSPHNFKLILFFMRVLAGLFLLLINSYGHSQNSLENSHPSAVETNDRDYFYYISLANVRHNLKGGDGNEVIGNSQELSLGMQYLDQSWYLSGSFDAKLGPYEPVRNNQLDTDYFGTGITLNWGISAQGRNLRSKEGSYGFALGLKYFDISGRSIGKNRKQSEFTAGGELDTLVENYVVRINHLSIVPAIFFSWLKEARQKGNSPELLKTRIEGYLLSFGLSMPISSSYNAQFDEKFYDESKLNSQETREFGSLRGYSFIVSLSALFDS